MAYVVELVGQEVTKGRNPQALLKYQVRGTEDKATAYGLVLAASPTVTMGLVRENARVVEEGGGIWAGTVIYGTMEQGEPGDISWSFNIGVENFHITNALAHVQSYAAAGTPPDHKGAIGVRQDGSGRTVEGVDIKVPVFTWEETHYASYETVASHGFIQTLESTTAKINDAPWRIWDKGETLFLGTSGAKRGEEPVGLTYRFASSRTKTGMTIGDITGVDKEGHHYLWIEYEKKEDGAANTLTDRPLAAHVERVYDYADITALGLPDPWA